MKYFKIKIFQKSLKNNRRTGESRGSTDASPDAAPDPVLANALRVASTPLPGARGALRQRDEIVKKQAAIRPLPTIAAIKTTKPLGSWVVETYIHGVIKVWTDDARSYIQMKVGGKFKCVWHLTKGRVPTHIAETIAMARQLSGEKALSCDEIGAIKKAVVSGKSVGEANMGGAVCDGSIDEAVEKGSDSGDASDDEVE